MAAPATTTAAETAWHLGNRGGSHGRDLQHRRT